MLRKLISTIHAPQEWQKPKAIFFDMDGVITKEGGYFEKSWAALHYKFVLGQYNFDWRNITAEQLAKGIELRNLGKGKSLYTRVEDYIIKPAHNQGLTPTMAILSYLKLIREQLFAEYRENPQDYLYPGTIPLLKYLQAQGYPTYIITANIQPQADFVTEFTGIKKYFTGVIGTPMLPAENFPAETPKIPALQALLKQHNLEPAQALFIADSYSDIDQGKFLGMRTLGIGLTDENSQELIQHKVDYLVPSTKTLDELKEIKF